MEMVQADINWWHRLLHATSGELNTKKCFCSDFNLQFDVNGTPSIWEKTTNEPQLYLTNLNDTKEILKATQPSKVTRITWESDCHVSSWFCSHPGGSYLRDQEQMTGPYQDRPPFHLTITQWHHSPSSSTYLTNDGSHLQQNQATSPLKSHIIIKSYLRGLQWDFCWNPQETDQDLGVKISFDPKLVHH